MNAKISTSHGVVGGYALLSPDLFLMLDRRARSLASRPIRVRSARDMIDDDTGRQLWGSLNFFATSVCTDLRLLADDSATHYTEIGVIDLANKVRLADFRASRRPEINWREIPDDRVIEYIVMHEIGHAVDNFYVDICAKHDEEVRGALYICNEVLADRFAWKSLFPGVPLPIDPERTVSPRRLKAMFRLLKAENIKRGKRSKRHFRMIRLHSCRQTTSRSRCIGQPVLSRQRLAATSRPSTRAGWMRGIRSVATGAGMQAR